MPDNGPTKAVGYIFKKFPVLSETFILNELLELEAQGIPIHIFSLERPNDPKFHEDLVKIKASISYVPDMFDAPKLYKMAKHANKLYGKNYGKTLRYVLRYGKPTLLWRFLQSCYVACQAKKFRIGHFHSHFATRPTTIAFLASHITNLPFSFTAHAMDIFKTNLSSKSLQKKIESARFVVTISEYNKNYLSQLVNGESEKIVKIYNGIKLDRFKPNHFCHSSPFVFICVARFVEKKGHHVLIEACKILHDRQIPFECWLVGKGKLRSAIENAIKKNSLTGHVKLLGVLTQVQVQECYWQTNAYVLPCIEGTDGNKDGLPVSIVEALASGLPVITTPMTGNPEVVRSNHNGMLVGFNDPKALADAMEKMIRDPGFYRQLRENTRASVASQFDLHQTARTLQHLFSESLS